MNTIRTALTLLGATLLLCVAGMIVLAGLDKSVPEALVGLAGTCAGGIAGLLTRVPPTDPSGDTPLDPSGDPGSTLDSSA